MVVTVARAPACNFFGACAERVQRPVRRKFTRNPPRAVCLAYAFNKGGDVDEGQQARERLLDRGLAQVLFEEAWERVHKVVGHRLGRCRLLLFNLWGGSHRVS